MRNAGEDLARMGWMEPAEENLQEELVQDWSYSAV